MNFKLHSLCIYVYTCVYAPLARYIRTVYIFIYLLFVAIKGGGDRGRLADGAWLIYMRVCIVSRI